MKTAWSMESTKQAFVKRLTMWGIYLFFEWEMDSQLLPLREVSKACRENMMLGLLCGFYACNAHPSWFQQDNCQRHCGAAQIYWRGVWWLQLGRGKLAEVLDLANVSNSKSIQASKSTQNLQWLPASSRVKPELFMIVYLWSDCFANCPLHGNIEQVGPENVPSIQNRPREQKQWKVYPTKLSIARQVFKRPYLFWAVLTFSKNTHMETLAFSVFWRFTQIQTLVSELCTFIDDTMWTDRSRARETL